MQRLRDNPECSVYRVGEGNGAMSYVIVDENLARRSLIDDIVMKVAVKPGTTAEDVLETLKVHRNIKTLTKFGTSGGVKLIN